MKIFSKILMLAAIAGVFCSCKKDGEGEGASSTTPKDVVISYSYSNTADFFELMNVGVEYIDKEGALRKETITKNWSYNATVPYASAPKEYKFVVTYSASVQELEQPKDNYSFQSSFVASVYKVLADGETKSVGRQDISDKQPKNWTKDSINDYLKLHAKDLSLSFETSLEEE